MSQQKQQLAPPPFDPLQPSTPVSYPLKTLEELESRSYFKSFHYPFNVSSVPLQASSSVTLADRPRILVCHDMMGGYTDDDKFVQGGTNAEAFAIWHWYLMDIFVYFSHNLVTLPPPGWTNAAHKHGVKVLGTFITESDEGIAVCNTLLATKESSQKYAELLAELAVALHFDGWLLNMEVTLDIGQIPILLEFVSHLTKTMHSSLPGSLVIWYDSVTIQGGLRYQNQLNDQNKPFFDNCDGIFVNYSWKEDYPKLSAALAGDRKFDVYMGIDVFGRGTYGGGQWTTNVALDVLKKDSVSAAIFAPGWVYESKQPPDFQTAQNHWWSLVEKSWGILQSYPIMLPFHSEFDQGRGYHYSIDGTQVSESPWCNLSLQSAQPFLEFSGNPNPVDIQVSVNRKEASYSEGGSIAFAGTLDDKAYFTTRLFLGELPLGNIPVHFKYSVKSDGISLIGLSLSFTKSSNEGVLVLLASSLSTPEMINHLSTKFSKVVMPHGISKSLTVPGWVIQESSIVMNGFLLTEIHVVCYKSTKPLLTERRSDSIIQGKESTMTRSLSAYQAFLGHITVVSSKEKVIFPPSTAWQVKGQYIKWTPGLKGSKFLSVKIMWRLRDGKAFLYPKYNIFVEHLTSKMDTNWKRVEGKPLYLGVAATGAFYVADFAVVSGTPSLKFTIQACSVDGSSQNLDSCPSLTLDVKGVESTTNNRLNSQLYTCISIFLVLVFCATWVFRG